MARRRFWNRQRGPLVAAAGGVVTGGSPATPEALVKRMERWQERILHLTAAVPEPAGASAVIRNTLDRVKLRVEVEGISDATTAELERHIRNFELGRAGQLIWLVGEAFPSWREDQDGSIIWETYSPIELKVERGKRAVLKDGPLGKDQELSSPWYRLWQPDPAHRYRAWSTHKALIEVLEAMHVHQLADTAVATSRLAGAGILFWPTDLPSMPLRDGRPEEGSRQELQEQLSKGMLEPITQRDSADAVVPLVVFGDPTYGEGQRPSHILFERPDDAKGYTERMNGYAQRYARGVELPIESTTGMGPANHWTAWVIKEEKWLEYALPIGQLVADSLNQNRIKPMLRELGVPADVVQRARVVADGSDLIAKPDLTDPALKAAQIGGILSDDAIVSAIGFDPAADKFDPARDKGNDGNRSATRLEEVPARFRDNKPAI